MARLAGGLVSKDVADRVGSEALNRLLDILATSMLTVTTFSLTVMVTVFRSSSQQFTPRAHRELMKDTRTQTALATFIGAYIYSLAGIVLSERQGFTEAEQAALYFTTLIVLALIVLQVLRWMVHLQTLGSLMHATSGIESEGIRMLEQRRAEPWSKLGALGDVPPGRTVHEEHRKYPGDRPREPVREARRGRKAAPLSSSRATSSTPARRSRWSREADLDDDDVIGVLHMGALRSTEQDPRFCLILLSEFASKALSPGVNDPGTAIDCLGRITRILGAYAPAPPAPDACVFVPTLSPEDLIVGRVRQIARDGAGIVEVQIFLQKRLAALMAHSEPGLAREAAAAAVRAGAGAGARGDERRVRRRDAGRALSALRG